MHAGSFWSQRFFLSRHRLHALTLRKLDDEAEDAPFEVAATPSPEPPSTASSAPSVTCGLARFFLLDELVVVLFISRSASLRNASAKRLRGEAPSCWAHRIGHTWIREQLAFCCSLFPCKCNAVVLSFARFDSGDNDSSCVVHTCSLMPDI